MIFIQILLVLAALYCGGMWLWVAGSALKNRATLDWGVWQAMELNTFHLGLCFILAAGFLGIILAIGG